MRSGLTRNAKRRSSLTNIQLNVPNIEDGSAAGCSPSLTMTMGSSCFFSGDTR